MLKSTFIDDNYEIKSTELRFYLLLKTQDDYLYEILDLNIYLYLN